MWLAYTLERNKEYFFSKHPIVQCRIFNVSKEIYRMIVICEYNFSNV